MKRIAVILSGCGVYDGTEVHEAVLTLLALQRAGTQVQCFAPDRNQMHVINHLTGEVMAEMRNILVESARIARGEVKAIAELNVAEFDALIVPGGFGAAKNLCDFAHAGTGMHVADDVKQVCRAFVDAGKVSGYLCIAPIMLPQIVGAGTVGTIGDDVDTAAAYTLMGGQHQSCSVAQVAVDTTNKVVSSPAYMLAGDIGEAAQSVDALVDKVLQLA
ncbi:isoprenoid biosynthesis glyoxalase ElbB [Ferrimonas lipolytica]|uniref:Glyoxalase n=1 Tax=Ferrimonas lipolytica TaxID=2724191 RepID=A0A6H1UIZ9_9GAMM|nr:isoprenoid biosynthesis glyoxalase ElbB [Ferrimonas lipolytica]QIZ78283.1 isoprenoid biosynthesis glyoxalase ElbB [Ferrimonas lipolytica]